MTSAEPALGAALDRWLARLDGEGFRVGVRERLLVQSLLATLAAHGELPAELRAVLALAAPLLCGSREQQRRYGELLDRFIAEDGGSGTESGTGTEAGRAGPPPRFGTVIASLAAVVAVLLLSWMWFDRRPLPTTPSPVTATPSAPAADTPEPPTAAASVPAFYVPPLPLPMQPWLRPAWSQPARAALLGLGGASALLLLGQALVRRRREVALHGLRTDDEIEHHLLHDVQPLDVAPHPTLARAVARVLRQRVAGETRALDTPATLRAMVAAGGAFAPRWRKLRRTPEYLVLVDTRHPADHFAAAAHTLVDALSRAGVALQAWGYDGTPAGGCWARGGLGNDDASTRQRLPLAALLTRAAGARLLVFGAADALLQPASGALQPWVAPLQALAERAWFTPLPVHAWGAAEQAADDAGFLVLPLQEAALATLAGWLSSRRLTLALDTDTPASFPALLRGAALDWVTRSTAPPPETVDELLQQLRGMLGGVRLQWLCACAVFPALTPPLTLALGRHLISDPRGLALGLAALSSLPWFRYGRMPAWLRRELLQRLAPDFRQRLDAEVRQRLDAALVDDRGAGGQPLLADIATRRARLLAALRQRKGPLQDVVLADFVRQASEDGLAHKLSPALRRRLFRGGDPGAGLRLHVLAVPVGLLAAALLAATPLWPALVGFTPQPALAAVGGFGPDATLALPTDQPTFIVGLRAVGETLIVVDEGGSRTSSPVRDFSATAFPDTTRLNVAPPTGAAAARTFANGDAAAPAPLAAQNADGLRIDWSGGRLLLRDATGAVLGAPLDTGGLGVQTAAFTASGSRVVAVLTDGSVRAWGRGLGQVPVAVVACDGADPSLGIGGDIARSLVHSTSEFYEVTAYTEAAWVTLRSQDRSGYEATPADAARPTLSPTDGATPPAAGEISYRLGQSDAAKASQKVAEFLAEELAKGVATSGKKWTVGAVYRRPGVTIGACLPNAADTPVGGGWAALGLSIPGLDAAAVQGLDDRVRAMYAADVATREAAFGSLSGDAERLSDAVPVAIARALQLAAKRPANIDAIAGVADTIDLLKRAPPASLNRERADLQQLAARFGGADELLQKEVASLQLRLKAVAALKPQTSIQIAGEFQRPLATYLAQRLRANNLQVAGIENIGDRAPAETVVRVQGASDRRIARNLRDASAKALGAAASLVSLRGDPANDTYEIWLDRALCATRQVEGCGASGGAAGVGASQPASGAVAAASAVWAAASAAMAAIATPPTAVASLVPNAATLDLITRFEGFQSQVYIAPNGVQTIGYGHALSIAEARDQEIRIGGDTIKLLSGISKSDARRLLAADLASTYRALATMVTVPLTDNQRGALASFAFNVGLPNLSNSDLLKALNAGTYSAVPRELPRWTLFGEKQVPGVQARRKAEVALWNSISPVGGAVDMAPAKK